MAASDHLSHIQFHVDAHYDEDSDEAYGDVIAKHGDKEVGRFSYEPWHSGGISPTTFGVDKQYRRQGIGHRLYDEALKASGGPIVHDTGTMSKAGRAAAESHAKKVGWGHDWV